MKGRAIEYASAGLRGGRTRWVIWGIGIVVLGLVVVSLPVVTVSETETRVDAVSGSVSRKTVWVSGRTTGWRHEASPLEKRLTKAGIQWRANWQFVHVGGSNIFGCMTSCGVGLKPKIGQMSSVMGEFVAGATEDELREFVRVMQLGTEAEQDAAVEAALEKVFRSGSRELH